MTPAERATQLKVGIFVVLGLAAVCSMVVYFGRFGDALKEFYNVRVEFPDASGLFMGADAVLAGAKIGTVLDGPHVLDKMDGVYVILKIYEEVSIPDVAVFSVGSSGLLGDSFVNITMPPGFDPKKAQAIKPGATIQGRKDSGFAQLTEEGGKLVADLRDAVKNINTVVNRINTEVLNPKTVGAVEETLSNLKTATSQFADSSKKLDGVLSDAAVAVKDASDAVKKTSDTIVKAGPALDSAKGAADEFKKTMVDARGLISQAKSSRGALGILLNDRQTAQNLRILVENLRKRGILWYKDTPAPGQKPPAR